jgi:hypothetical protein
MIKKFVSTSLISLVPMVDGTEQKTFTMQQNEIDIGRCSLFLWDQFSKGVARKDLSIRALPSGTFCVPLYGRRLATHRAFG